MGKEHWRDDLGPQVTAVLMTALIMVLSAMVLLKNPLSRIGALHPADPAAMRLELIDRAPPPPAAVTPSKASAPATPTAAKPTTAAARSQAPPAKRAAATPQAEVATTPDAQRASRQSIANAIYTKQGRVRLPPGVAQGPAGVPPGTPPGMPSARDEASAKNVLEKPNPIKYEATRFDKDWASSGTLGDLAQQKATRAIKDLFKSERSSAVARPPPQTRFNPALAQNQADLGSEATGDAYKAAPIGFEKALQPPGEASKAIRAQLEALQARALMCKDPQKDRWLGDVRKNLADLEHNETALTHGADVQRAQYYLPQAIDAAYDLSRRALWYADKRLSVCGK